MTFRPIQKISLSLKKIKFGVPQSLTHLAYYLYALYEGPKWNYKFRKQKLKMFADDATLQISRNYKEEVEHHHTHPFKKGILPYKIKISKVVPLHKKNDKENPNNYRPGLFNQYSINFESVFLNRILTFLESNQIINGKQNEIRKNCSPLDYFFIIGVCL